MAVAVDVIPMLKEEARQRQADGGRIGGSKLLAIFPEASRLSESNNIETKKDESGYSREIAGKLLSVSGRMVQRGDYRTECKDRQPRLSREPQGARDWTLLPKKRAGPEGPALLRLDARCVF